jgi:hypothetical protein
MLKTAEETGNVLARLSPQQDDCATIHMWDVAEKELTNERIRRMTTIAVSQWNADRGRS